MGISRIITLSNKVEIVGLMGRQSQMIRIFPFNMIKCKPLDVRRLFNFHSGEIAIFAVTLGELVYGAEYSQQSLLNKEVVEGFASVEVLADDTADACHFGQ